MLKKISAIMLAILVIFSKATYEKNPNAQTAPKKEDILLPIYLNNKYGFINQNGKVIVKPKYDMAFQSVNGFASGMIKEGDLNWSNGHEEDTEVLYYMGFNYSEDIINSKGNVIISIKKRSNAEYERSEFHDGLLPVYGCRDATESAYISGSDDMRGTGDIYGSYCINEKGEKVIKFLQDVKDFSGGFAFAENSKGKWGVIDTEGNFVVKPKYDNLHRYKGGFARVEISSKGNLYKSELIDQRGKVLIQTKDYMSDDQVETIINNYQVTKGKLPMSYRKHEELFYLNDNIIAYKYKNKWGNINNKGKVILEPIFDELNKNNFIENKVISVRQGKKWGMLDTSGKIILKPMYDSIDGLIFVSKGKKGLMNSKGKVVLPAVYDELIVRQKGFIYYAKGKEKGYLNNQKKCIWRSVEK